LQLKTFEINNFRSIKHVKCQISPKITVLAGKNESGKTNVLLALERFDTDFTDDDKPRGAGKDEIPSIEGNFVLSKKEVEQVLEKLDISIDNKSFDLTVKTSPDYKYKFSGSYYEILKNKIEEPSREPLNDFNNLIQTMKEVSEEQGSSIDLDSIQSLESTIVEKNLNQLTSMQQQLTKNPNLWGGSVTMDRITSSQGLLNQLREYAKKMDELHKILESLVPSVVLFDSFEDQLPSEIDLTEAINIKNNDSEFNIVTDFVELSELNLEALQNPDRQNRAQVTSRATTISSELFGKYWKQDPIDIEIKYDEPKLTFFVKDRGDDYPFKPEQRSKGIQWFMCFLARLKAQGAYENNLILVDEPGLYLHAQAQQNVLDLLEEIADDNNQIIFSTHSPYLIDPDKLNRIRLVIKDKTKKITQIENQFNKNADIETITPIITAIGLDISKGVAFAKKCNIIVEGVSDYYYILGMKKFLEQNKNYKFPEDVAIIPCVGESKVNSVASILTGYGLDYRIVVDEKGTKHTRKKLEADGLADKIVTVGNNSNESIEDLFNEADWKKYNSPEGDLSKTWISKSFYEDIESGKSKTFTTQTINNFTNLLNNLKFDQK